MNKNNLLKFIQKYSLGGLIESVAWNAEGTKLSVRFISDDKTLLGEVEYNAYTSTPMNVGIYTTSLLKNMIGVLDNDLTLKVYKAGEKSVSLKLSSEINLTDNCVPSAFHATDSISPPSEYF
jgi:hypothetical protein